MKIHNLEIKILFSALFIFALSLLLLFNLTPAYAKVQGDTIYLDLEFSAPKILPSLVSPMYSHIGMQGLDSFGEVGEPVLPVKGLKVLIPPGKKVKTVDIILGEKITLPGYYIIEPGQLQYPLSQIGKIKPRPTQAKKGIYQKDAAYPFTKHKLQALHKKLGYPIAVLNIFPVEYNPKKKEVSYYKSISVAIRLEANTLAMFGARLRGKGRVREIDRIRIQRIVDNKEDINLVDQAVATSNVAQFSQAQARRPPLTLGLGQYDYVIITCSNFVPGFEPLKQRKIRNGLTAIIVTTDWIYANYPGNRPDGGVDNQTKIRNFIIDAYNNWDTQYVLLGGDADGAYLGGETEEPIIPTRGLSDATFLEYVETNIPADLYYACLEGTFDHNANGIYGEPTDGEDGGEVDLLAEVYVGRACVDSVSQVNNFVNKTLVYEDSTDSYLKTNYMLGEHLNGGGISEYATANMEEIRLGSDINGFTTQGLLTNPDRSLDSDVLYDSAIYTWSKTDLTNIINNGVHILNHLGHTNNTIAMKLGNSDVDRLTNNKYSIIYSQGCYAGAFDNRSPEGNYLATDCIGKHLTANATGAVAFIGNSRYGWFEMNSTAGSSQYYNRQFWDALFNEGIIQLGRMNQDSKEDNIPYLSYRMNRWCYFDLNLFGDPALSVHLPGDLIIDISHYSFENAIIAPGQSIGLTTNLKAFNQDAANVTATLSSSDPNVTIEQTNANFGNILKGQTANNSNSPFRFTISQDCARPHTINFTLTIVANGYAKNRKLLLDIPDPRERRITYNLSDKFMPVISGNRIVWCDWRNGIQGDIYMYDLSTNTERQITNSSADKWFPGISGNRIVWQDYRNGNCDIYMYDLFTNTERQITNNPKDQKLPAISGNYIVWQDWRNFYVDIYMYDLSTNTERRITTDSSNHFIPAISGRYAAWETRTNYNYLYIYDLFANTILPPVRNQVSVFDQKPSISGNYIVWQDFRSINNADNEDIHMYDLFTHTERQITNDPANQIYPVVSSNYIVWMDDRNNGNWNLYMYDLSTNTERQITNTLSYFPAISGNRIVWQDNRNGNWDIYTYDLETASPTGSIRINNGAIYTNNPSVILDLSATDAGSGMGAGAQMCFSNDKETWSQAEAYVTIKDWILSPDEGSKTVYVKFSDAVGNWSSAYVATITLDTIPPKGIATLEYNRTIPGQGRLYNLNLLAKDAGSGMGSGAQVAIQFKSRTAWVKKDYVRVIQILITDNTVRNILVKFKDVAENWSIPIVVIIPVKWPLPLSNQVQ